MCGEMRQRARQQTAVQPVPPPARELWSWGRLGARVPHGQVVGWHVPPSLEGLSCGVVGGGRVAA